MQTFTARQLNHLADRHNHLLERLQKASDDLALCQDTAKTPINLDCLADLLQACAQSIKDSTQLITQYELSLQQTEKLSQDLRLRDQEAIRLLQQNQSLAASLQEVKGHFDNIVGELEKKYEASKGQMEISNRTQIEEKQTRLNTQLQYQLKQYQQKIDQRQKQVVCLTQTLDQMQYEMRLLQDELELAEMAVEDLCNKAEQPCRQKISNLWDTYSPSPNSSQRTIALQSSQLIDLNRKRSSLLQDFFESDLAYSEPHLTSKINISKETIEQIEQNYCEKNNLLEGKLSPVSNGSFGGCINCRLQSLIQSHRTSDSVGVQATEDSHATKLYKWFKLAIVDARIRKR